VLAFKGPVLDVTVERMLQRAEQVESEYGLPARRWVRELLARQGSGPALVV
jgi:hypothetical protein